MKRNISILTLAAMILCMGALADKPEGDGWESLFNGKDFSGWKNPNDEIWTVQDGVIDCAPRVDIEDEKNLWTEEEYGDIELYIEWRIKETKGEYEMPVVLPDGTEKKNPDGSFVVQSLPNADSGIYLRGDSKSQINIWCWPVGSGEVYGYRTDKTQPAEVRAGVTPKLNADNPVGEWNSFHITMKGDRLTVVLNGKTVIENAQLPGIADKGAIALQHHGGFDPRRDYWSPASSLVQFREIWMREIDGDTAKKESVDTPEIIDYSQYVLNRPLHSCDLDPDVIAANDFGFLPKTEELGLRGWDSWEMRQRLEHDGNVVYLKN